MSTYAYHLVSKQIQQLAPQIQQLTPDEQFQLLEDLITLLRSQTAAKPLHSILELKGLGKEIWEGIDVDQYINEERDSWDG